MFFGALVFWAAISFTGTTSDASVRVAPVGVAASDAPSEPEGGVPDGQSTCEPSRARKGAVEARDSEGLV